MTLARFSARAVVLALLVASLGACTARTARDDEPARSAGPEPGQAPSPSPLTPGASHSADRLALPPGADPVPRDAVDVVLEAFASHSVVAIGEIHGSVAEHAFLEALLEDPRTPALVDDIVVEFGNARFQDVMDRYTVGEPVPESSLTKVWTETTQTSGVWNLPVYRAFFEVVRRVNAQLPTEDQFRVLLGDPPIDWSVPISSPPCDESDPDCLDHWLFQRDEHFARVVEEQSLSRGRRALLVAGLHHLVRRHDPLPPSIVDALDAQISGDVFVVLPHESSRIGSEEVESRIRAWPAPAIAPLAGTWLGEIPFEDDVGAVTCDGPGCGTPAVEETTTLSEVTDSYLFLG